MYEDQVKYMISVLWLLALLSCIPYIQANTYNIPSSTYPCKRPRSLDEYFLQKSFITFSVVCCGLVSSMILFICYFEIIRGLYFTNTICSKSSDTEADRKTKKQLAQSTSDLAGCCLFLLFTAISYIFPLPYFLG